MNLYEALTAYDKCDAKLTSSAAKLYLELLIKLNKNYWNPVKISWKDVGLAKNSFYRTRDELISAGLLNIENGFYELSQICDSKTFESQNCDRKVPNLRQESPKIETDSSQKWDKNQLPSYNKNKNKIYINNKQEDKKNGKGESNFGGVQGESAAYGGEYDRAFKEHDVSKSYAAKGFKTQVDYQDYLEFARWADEHVHY